MWFRSEYLPVVRSRPFWLWPVSWGWTSIETVFALLIRRDCLCIELFSTSNSMALAVRTTQLGPNKIPASYLPSSLPPLKYKLA